MDTIYMEYVIHGKEYRHIAAIKDPNRTTFPENDNT